MTCDHRLGTLPCDNPDEHKGAGKGCTFTAAWVADGHDASEAGDE